MEDVQPAENAEGPLESARMDSRGTTATGPIDPASARHAPLPRDETDRSMGTRLQRGAAMGTGSPLRRPCDERGGGKVHPAIETPPPFVLLLLR